MICIWLLIILRVKTCEIQIIMVISMGSRHFMANIDGSISGNGAVFYYVNFNSNISQVKLLKYSSLLKYI